MNYNPVLENIYEYIQNNNINIVEKTDKWVQNTSSILKEFVESFDLELNIPEIKNLGYWFVPNAIVELQIIKNSISQIEDKDLYDFVLIAFSETVRQVSNRRNGEFKMYRMPKEKVLKFRPNVKQEFFDILDKNVFKMNNFYDKCNNQNKTEVYIFNNDARYLEDIPDDSIDLIITSPPYGDSRTTVAYGEFSKVSLQWLNIEGLTNKDIISIDKKLMGGTKFKKGFKYDLNSHTLKAALNEIMKEEQNLERAGDVYSFYKDLQETINTIIQKCKKNSYQFWVVGNRTVKGVNLKTNQIIKEMGE